MRGLSRSTVDTSSFIFADASRRAGRLPGHRHEARERLNGTKTKDDRKRGGRKRAVTFPEPLAFERHVTRASLASAGALACVTLWTR